MAGVDDLERDFGAPAGSDGLSALERDHGTIPAPGKGDLAAPPPAVEPVDENAHPSWLASAVRGLGEGVGVGPLARRLTAAGRMVLPNALGGTDKTYAENLADEEARSRGAATDHPETYAPSKIAGGITSALRLNPAAFASLAGGNTLLEGGSVADAGEAAALSYGLGKMGGGEGIKRLAPLVVGGVGAARTAMNPDLPIGDRLAAAGEGALSVALPGLAKLKAKGAARLEQPRAKALAETETLAQKNLQADAMERAAQEQVPVRDVEKQRAQTDRETQARTSAAADAERATVGQIEAVNADVNKARASQVADVGDAAKAETAAAGTIRDAKYDREMRVHRDAKADLHKQKVEEMYANRRAHLDHADEMAHATAAYDAAKAAWDDHVARQSDLAEKAQANAQRTLALRREHTKLTAAHEKALADVDANLKEIADLGLDPADVDATVAGRVGEMFRETHTRLSNLIAGGDAHGLAIPQKYRDLHKYITATLLRNTPRKVDDMLEFMADPPAKIAKMKAEEAARRGPGFTQTPDAEPQPDLPPTAPTMADAEKSLAEKEAERAYVHPDDRGAVDAAAKARTDLDALRANPPERPNDAPHQQHLRDVERAKLDAGPTPLPPKPDAITKRESARGDKAWVARQIADAEASIPRQPVADAHEGALPAYSENLRGAARSDPGLILDKRAPIRPLGPEDVALDKNGRVIRPETSDERTIKMLAQGRQNVQDTLDAARVTQPHVGKAAGEQFIRETRSPLVSHSVRAASTAAGGALGASIAGVPGAAAGAAVGERVGHALAGRSHPVVSKFLKRTPEGDRYVSPAGAHAVLEAGQKTLTLKDVRRRMLARAAAQAEEADRKRKAHR